jgi:hypothetical protein
MPDTPTEVVAITLTVQTADPETVARTIEVIARTAAGLALEPGPQDAVTIEISRIGPDQEDAQP